VAVGLMFAIGGGDPSAVRFAVALGLRGHKELLGKSGGAAISFVVEEEERTIFSVV